MRPRFWLVLAVLMMAELGVFAWRHGDAVALSGPRERLLADAAFPAMARRLAARERVSRRLLERVLDIAAERGEADLRVVVLERIVADAPEDPRVRLRLASALRDAGRLPEAERLFRAELARATAGGER